MNLLLIPSFGGQFRCEVFLCVFVVVVCFVNNVCCVNQIGNQPIGLLETGIVAAFSDVLSKAEVDIFYISTFMSDFGTLTYFVSCAVYLLK